MLCLRRVLPVRSSRPYDMKIAVLRNYISQNWMGVVCDHILDASQRRSAVPRLPAEGTRDGKTHAVRGRPVGSRSHKAMQADGENGTAARAQPRCPRP